MKYIFLSLALFAVAGVTFAGQTNIVKDVFSYVDTHNIDGKFYKMVDEEDGVNCYLFVDNQYGRVDNSCVKVE